MLPNIIINKESSISIVMQKERQKLKEAGLDDLEIIELEKSPLQKIIQKGYIILVALFLILLLIVNTNAGYHIINLVSGKLVTSRFENYVFTINENRKVVFTNQTWNELLILYSTNQKHEFAACLKGEIKGGTYHVDQIYSPTTFRQDVYSVTSQMCRDSIIALHSHPPLKCLFSEQDLKTYEEYQKIDPKMMMALMCSETMISFYPGN